MMDPCRYDEAASLHTENAPAPSFAAVRRDQCRVVVTRTPVTPGSPLVWRHSSEFARRGRCRECDTSMVMDYEWFEPNTIWPVRPSWVKVSGLDRLSFPIMLFSWQVQEEETVMAENAFNNGKADIDVCWNSRGDPCTATTK